MKRLLRSLLFVIFQILTDAALLKRQKLEIEELRLKLQVIILFFFDWDLELRIS